MFRGSGTMVKKRLVLFLVLICIAVALLGVFAFLLWGYFPRVHDPEFYAEARGRYEESRSLQRQSFASEDNKLREFATKADSLESLRLWNGAKQNLPMLERTDPRWEQSRRAYEEHALPGVLEVLSSEVLATVPLDFYSPDDDSPSRRLGGVLALRDATRSYVFWLSNLSPEKQRLDLISGVETVCRANLKMRETNPGLLHFMMSLQATDSLEREVFVKFGPRVDLSETEWAGLALAIFSQGYPADEKFREVMEMEMIAMAEELGSPTQSWIPKIPVLLARMKSLLLRE